MTIKILIGHNKSPEFHDLFTVKCNNICEKLGENIEKKWLIYPPADIPKNNHGTVFERKNYKNILKIVNQINPDVILINGSLDFHNVELSLVSKFKKIPLITIFNRNNSDDNYIPITRTLVSRIREIFSNKIIAVHKNEIKSAEVNMLQFYKDRYSSLIQTLKIVKYKKTSILKFILTHAILVLTNRYAVNKMIEGTLNFCVIPNGKSMLVQKGFREESVFIIGDPYFDKIFTESLDRKSKKNYFDTQKKHIVFCTSTMHEHGFCSKEDEYQLIRNTIQKLIAEDSFEVIIKIHPATSSLKEYEIEVLDKLNVNVKICQKQNLIDLVQGCDVLVSYGGSGAILYGIILKKPILNLDFETNATKNNTYSDGKIIYECKNIDLLITDIKKTMSKKISDRTYTDYLENFIGILDGHSSERAAELILDILKDHRK